VASQSGSDNPPALIPWLAQAAAATSFSSQAALPGLSIPALVIHGKDDNVVDYRNGELLARLIPGAKTRLVRDTGHLGFWEEPKLFAASVSSFFDQN
jgi:non-heme chloroperoxidase